MSSNHQPPRVGSEATHISTLCFLLNMIITQSRAVTIQYTYLQHCLFSGRWREVGAAANTHVLFPVPFACSIIEREADTEYRKQYRKEAITQPSFFPFSIRRFPTHDRSHGKRQNTSRPGAMESNSSPRLLQHFTAAIEKSHLTFFFHVGSHLTRCRAMWSEGTGPRPASDGCWTGQALLLLLLLPPRWRTRTPKSSPSSESASVLLLRPWPPRWSWRRRRRRPRTSCRSECCCWPRSS